MENKTPVIVREWKATGDLIAFFPAQAATMNPSLCMSYMVVGQHSAANYNGLLELTKPVSTEVASDFVSAYARAYGESPEDYKVYQRQQHAHIEQRMQPIRDWQNLE